MRCAPLILAVGLVIALAAGTTCAQQVTIGSPFHTLSDNFFERMGVGFAGSYRGMNFSVGSFGQALPTFGDPKTGAGLQTAFSIIGPKGQLNFAFDLSQGSSRTNVMQDPMLTIMNGQTGFVSDTSQTPFVISVVPVVGAFPSVLALSPVPSPQQLAAAAGIPLTGANPHIQAMREAAAAAAADGQAGGMVAPPQRKVRWGRSCVRRCLRRRRLPPSRGEHRRRSPPSRRTKGPPAAWRRPRRARPAAPPPAWPRPAGCTSRSRGPPRKSSKPYSSEAWPPRKPGNPAWPRSIISRLRAAPPAS